MSGHDIDALLRAAADGPQVDIPAGWGQGRATFGGVVAGALVARGLGEIDADPVTLRAMTANFLAPAVTGPATLRCEILRQGKSATQLEVRLLQADDDASEPTVRALALLTFGAERPSRIEVPPRAAGERAPFDSLPTMADVVGPGAPDFLSRVDLRVAAGGYPFSGSSGGSTAGWMRFRELTSEFGLAHFVTLVDAWPPTAAQMLPGLAPVSTMTWTMEFLAPLAGTPETTWWYDVVTDAAHHGYAHSHATIHDADGRMVAVSRQTVALFG